MKFVNEREFEAYIRKLIATHITTRDSSVYALNNKKAVDILICKNEPVPELFFIEVKFHKARHGRLGIGGRGGGGFQPEIVNRMPLYFERNLRWVLASEEHPGKVLFITSEILRRYLSGGCVGEKFNNVQKRIFCEENGLMEHALIDALGSWVGLQQV